MERTDVMLVEQGFHQPYNWGRTRPVRDDTTGVHQIRIHHTSSIPEHRRPPAPTGSYLEVACNCSAHLAWIRPGEDCWTPFNDHLRSVNDNH